MGNSRLLFIPVETKVREFLAKLLLSSYAAEVGFEVTIGEQVELLRRIKYMPRGIYIEKGLASTKIDSVNLLHKLGNRVVSWCEEGLVILKREAYARDRVSREVISELDIILAWGNVQTEALQMKMSDVMKKIVISGNPRFDLLRSPYKSIFSSKADEIRARYGKFILINTNFGIYNNFYGKDFFVLKMMEGHGRIINREHRQFLNRWVDHVEKTFWYFVRMVKRFSREFPGHKIIVRPHPSENHQAWRKETQGLSNVNVVHEDNVIPWILASDVLIHNSCTTGVEAYVLEKPVVSYRPIVSETYEPELPRSLSICVFSEDELVETSKRVLEDVGKNMNPLRFDTNVQELLEKYVVSTNGSFACEKIVTALVSLADKADDKSSSSSVSFMDRIRLSLEDYRFNLRVMLNQIIKGSVSDLTYRTQKFPGLTLNEIRKGVESFQKVTNRFASLKVKKLDGAKACFRIYSEEKQ